MFKSIKRANVRIKELELQIQQLNLSNSDLKYQISQNENNVSAQDFADMRLRAQKAELALEAIRQADIDAQIKVNMRNASEKEAMKASVTEALILHLQNFKG